jgi:hypothetical protein
MKKIVIATLAAFPRDRRHGSAGRSTVLVEWLCLALLASPRVVVASPSSLLGSLRIWLRVALLSHPEPRAQRWSTAAPALAPAILPKTEPETRPVPPG